jgi:hypothetical protein
MARGRVVCEWKRVVGFFYTVLALVAVLSAILVFFAFASSAYLDCMQR